MKLAITHTKKVPGRQDFSSEGFGATIEVEVPDDQSQDAAAIQQWLHELYEQAKDAVEEQIKTLPVKDGSAEVQAAVIPRLFARSNGSPAQSSSPNGNGQSAATPKQVSYLIALGARNKISYADLVEVAKERFKAEDLYRLSKQDASQMIDELRPQPNRV